MARPRAAIFDVDRTLLDGMSGFLFSRHLLRYGNLSPWAKLRIASAVFRYRTRLSPEEAMVEIGVTVYAGKRLGALRELADACVADEMAGRCFAEALARIAAHAEAGDHVLLASGSSNVVIEALADRVGAHGVVATRAETKGGISTKRIAYPLCYKEGKLELVARYLAEREMAVEDAVLYTDNLADVPLLERVAEPVCVNPHPDLEAIAAERGWPVERWTTPTDGARAYSGSSFPLRGV